MTYQRPKPKALFFSSMPSQLCITNSSFIINFIIKLNIHHNHNHLFFPKHSNIIGPALRDCFEAWNSSLHFWIMRSGLRLRAILFSQCPLAICKYVLAVTRSNSNSERFVMLQSSTFNLTAQLYITWSSCLMTWHDMTVLAIWEAFACLQGWPSGLQSPIYPDGYHVAKMQDFICQGPGTSVVSL